MRSALAISVLALAALAAYPPETQHPRDVVAAVAVHDVAPSVEVAPAAAVELERAGSTVEGFMALKSSDASRTVASPEVLAAPAGCSSHLAPFHERDLEVTYLPSLKEPTWRLIGPNREVHDVGKVARG